MFLNPSFFCKLSALLTPILAVSKHPENKSVFQGCAQMLKRAHGAVGMQNTQKMFQGELSSVFLLVEPSKIMFLI